MRLVSHEQTIFGDTPVPDLFIQDVMVKLDGDAVKAYLFLLSHSKRGTTALNRSDIGARLGLDDRRADDVLMQLQAENLLTVSDSEIRMTDLKALELQKRFRPLETADPSEIIGREKHHREREQVVNDINMTFFQGTMVYTWYELIDKWFVQYHFEPEVVHAAFQEAANAKALNTRAYVSRVAEDWYKAGVRTYAQLTAYYERFCDKKTVMGKVAETMNRRLTAPDKKCIANWMDVYGYDEAIIMKAMEKLTGASSPSVKYVDAILTEWHRAGLKTPDDIRAYEEDYEARKKKGAASRPAGFTMSEETRRQNEERSRKIAERMPLPRLRKDDNE